jgi:hypothetical protein
VGAGDNQLGAEEDGRAAAEEEAQQQRDGPFVGEVGGDLDLERVVGVVGDHGGDVEAARDVLHHEGGCHCVLLASPCEKRRVRVRVRVRVREGDGVGDGGEELQIQYSSENSSEGGRREKMD